MLHDLRIATRSLRRDKGFALAAAFVLALGIAAVTTQYAVVDGALLRGLTFNDSQRLVAVELASPADGLSSRVTEADFDDLRARQTSFVSLVGYLNITGANVVIQGTAQRRNTGYISTDFFRTLGVAPALGRDFTADDDRPGLDPVVILSHAMWQEDFAGSPNILGRTLRLNGRLATVVGVMPSGFVFPWAEKLWTPMHVEFPAHPRHERQLAVVSMIGRLKEGVDIATASAEIRTLAADLATRHPENRDYCLGRLRPLIETFAPTQLAQTLRLLMAFAVGVLLIACVNVALMQLARSAARGREYALRAALGASRLHLLRQLLTENLLLAALGAIPGVLLAQWGVDYIDRAIRQFSNSMPAWMRFSVDGSVLAIVVAAVVFATLLSGILPAAIVLRRDLATTLGTSGRGIAGSRSAWLSRGLVSAQIALTAILLVGATLQLRSIIRRSRLDHGYDTAGVYSARVGLMAAAYPTDAARIAFHEQFLRTLRTTPEIAAAALSDRYRMAVVEDAPVEIANAPGSHAKVFFERVTDGYFGALGQHLVEGRDFSANDSDVAQPVAIVNASFARRFFPGRSALGCSFRPLNANPAIAEPWRVVVGVVSDVRMPSPFDPRLDNGGYYVPFTATVPGDGSPHRAGLKFATIVLRPRTGASPESLEPVLRRVVGTIDPDTPIYYTGTPRSQLDGFLAQTRLTTGISMVVGVLAVCLAAAGLYGVTAYMVDRRQREFGIRFALGASRRQVLEPVLRQAASSVGIGLALGLPLAYAATAAAGAFLGDFLHGASALDPAVYLAVPALLTAVAFMASCIPARRAARVDPMIVLRAE
ncbi:MAG TPA: ABC transporter permease [Opitutaceae bacterium]|nr:ABC transporter permease [Opitutaceae bacterium]